MTTEELREQNELADALIAKLERIKALQEEILPADAFDDLERKLDGIASSAESIIEKTKSDDFPNDSSFDDLGDKLRRIVGSLDEIIEKQEEVVE